MISRVFGEFLIFLVRLYQVVLGPVLGGHCRFHPTCSAYFIDAVRVRGVFRGVLLGAWRVLRCNPFSRGGFDPVPPAQRTGTDNDVTRCHP
jgi:hypothetical protein